LPPAGNFTDDQKTAVKAASRGYFVGNLFLWLSDPTRFGDLVLQLKDDYMHGVNNFPGSLQDAVTLMQVFENNRIKARRASNMHKPHHGKTAAHPHATGGSSSDTKPTGASLYNDATVPTPLSSGPAEDHSSTSTKKSGKTKATTKTGSTSVLFATEPSADCAADPELFTDFDFAQYDALISDTWILLDNQSTVDIFCNRNLLSDIHDVDVPLTVHSTGGPRVVIQMGMLRNYGLVWFCPDGIANIISMSNAENLGFDVSYSSASGAFHVTNPKTGTDRVFTRSDCGLFLF
jgi:hypothetical protein